MHKVFVRSRRRQILTVAAIALAVSLPLAACSSGSASGSPSSATSKSSTAHYSMNMMLNFAPNGEDAAFYYGNQQGLFKKNGVNLTIVPGTTSANTITAVTSGRIDIGFASVKNLLASQAAGQKTKSVGNMFGIGSNGVFVDKNSGITKIKQLGGKTIIAADSGIEALLTALMKKEGAAPPKYATVTSAAINTTYASGQGDGLLTSIPFGEAAVGSARPSNTISLASAGLNIPDYTFFVSPSYYAKNKPQIRAFLTGMYDSVVATTKNYTAAGKAVHAAVPSVPANVAAETFKDYASYICSPAMKGKTIGYMSQGDWNKAVTSFVGAGLVPAGFSADGMLTNEFVQGKNPVTSQMCPIAGVSAPSKG
jgi:NitT/TauT family transport system substrate-binding protein